MGHRCVRSDRRRSLNLHGVETGSRTQSACHIDVCRYDTLCSGYVKHPVHRKDPAKLRKNEPPPQLLLLPSSRRWNMASRLSYEATRWTDRSAVDVDDRHRWLAAPEDGPFAMRWSRIATMNTRGLRSEQFRCTSGEAARYRNHVKVTGRQRTRYRHFPITGDGARGHEYRQPARASNLRPCPGLSRVRLGPD